MKTLRSFLAVGLFLVGIGFTSCSSDDDVMPETPEVPANPVEPVPENPIENPVVAPL